MTELPHAAGEVISYPEMCRAWSASLQKGMNFHLRPNRSVILMSRRSNAPYQDRIEDEGRVLIYKDTTFLEPPNHELIHNRHTVCGEARSLAKR
jgi:hypothetical protein